MSKDGGEAMTEEQAFEKLQQLLGLAEDLVGEHYGAVDIINELMNRLDISVDELN